MNHPAWVTMKQAAIKVSAPFERFWHSLNTPQRLYFSAFFISIYAIVFANQDSTGWVNLVAVLVLCAMTYEFWPKFLVFWESLPGKAIILLFYAFIANYALVQAAGMINDITGVSSDPLPYSHNLSVLLSLPTWFFLTTIVLLLLLQIIQPLYLLMLILLRPFGLHRIWQPTDYKFPVTTGLLRFIFSLFILVQVANLLSHTGLSGGVNQFFKGWFEIIANQPINVTTANNEGPQTSTVNVLKLERAEQQTVSAEQDPDFEDFKMRISTVSENTVKYETHLKRILAHFIYEYEADSRSRCEHAQGTRVIELNDYEILQITKLDDSNTLSSYQYDVLPCISAALGHQFKTRVMTK
ncbi:hypothetical protein QNM18_20755 [Pseudoalteromonas sp. P94(2023)]|uniref:Uncharacterized protein n=2 Tax=Pseudoalteromonas obscura TaxID=3048491 RepID=A0ABT7ER20_9GAMM|nr:hypothetical protein [Pseudoalteromonas sp. P94(2023)]